MNNNRLSTNKKENLAPSVWRVLDAREKLNTNLSPNLTQAEGLIDKGEQCDQTSELQEKIKDLLNRPSNFEIYPDGKIFIKSEQKF